MTLALDIINAVGDALVRAAPPRLVLVSDQRPRTRGDCIEGVRPCPWVGCRHHLYLDVNKKTGHLRLNFPDLEPDQLVETCALDVAARGGATGREVAQYMGCTYQRIGQIEQAALAKLLAAAPWLSDYIQGGRS